MSWTKLNMLFKREAKEVNLCFLADGTSVHTVRWLNLFKRLFNVHLVTSKAPRLEGVTVHELGFTVARDSTVRAYAEFPVRMMRVRQKLRELCPDVVHAHYVTNYGVCAALSGKPFILSAWGDDILVDPAKSRLKRLLVKFALKRATLVHTNSAKKQLLRLGCDSRKIVEIPWGINIERFRPEARSERLREALGVQPSEYMVICTRYWQSLYSVDLLVRAAAVVLKHIGNVKFVLLGGGVQEAELKSLARHVGVADNLVFIGKVAPEQVAPYLASSDLYVDPYSAWRRGIADSVDAASGIGQSTREAMACGLPTIIANSYGQMFLEWFSSFVYDGYSSMSLAEMIVHVLRHPNWMLTAGQQGRQTAVRLFDERRMVRRWTHIYRRLAEHD